jgi:hypothetical protein
MKSTESTWLDQANAIALQAEALASDLSRGVRYAAVRRLLHNVETLAAWTELGD